MSTALSSTSIIPGSFAAWCVALRPRTLWIATVPVIVGSSVAYAASGTLHLGVALLALSASVLLQVITNLQNDVGYTARGADSARRVGLPRATAAGLLASSHVRRAILLAVVVTMLLGLPLVLRGGVVVLVIGLGSIAAALGYMGGPRPIAYTPLGELTVLVFFGVAAVAGSMYVQVGAVTPAAWGAALAIGMLAAAVLAVNNHRDAAHDSATGRHTFVVVFGTRASMRLYAWLVMLPYPVAVVAAFVGESLWFALPVLTLPRAIELLRDFRSTQPGPAFNGLLFRTVKLEVAFGALLALGALVTGLR